MTMTDATRWTEVAVTEIRRSRGEDAWQRKHVMILSERGGDRTLPIWIGPAEAEAMAVAMESAESPRPFTPKLAVSLVEAAGSGIEEVRVTRLLEGVFYATVIVRSPGGSHGVDARPSDAVNLALVAGTAIRVDDELFELGRALRVRRGTSLPSLSLPLLLQQKPSNGSVTGTVPKFE